METCRFAAYMISWNFRVYSLNMPVREELNSFNESIKNIIDGGFGILKFGTDQGFIENASLDQIKYEINKHVERH
jgi:hypothetical protein